MSKSSTNPSLESLAAELAALRDDIRRMHDDFSHFDNVARLRLHTLSLNMSRLLEAGEPRIVAGRPDPLPEDAASETISQAVNRIIPFGSLRAVEE